MQKFAIVLTSKLGRLEDVAPFLATRPLAPVFVITRWPDCLRDNTNRICNPFFVQREASRKRMRQRRRVLDAMMFGKRLQRPSLFRQGRLDVGGMPILPKQLLSTAICHISHIVSSSRSCRLYIHLNAYIKVIPLSKTPKKPCHKKHLIQINQLYKQLQVRA